MSWWERRVVPRLVDAALSSSAVSRERAAVCSGLTGTVLEIGFGSGLNLPHLPSTVTALHAVEPSDLAWSLSAPRRAGRSGVAIERIGLDGHDIDATDQTYDAVLCTFTLCTIPTPSRALGEVARLLRPGGRLHLLEHGASPDPGVRRWQSRLEPVQRRLAGGCHLTRDPFELAVGAGFRMVEGEQGYLPGPAVTRAFSYGFRGVFEFDR